MNYQLIGQIKGAKAVSRKDKTTGAIIANTEVIVNFEDYDKDGELVMYTETVQFDVNELQNFKDHVHKFVCIHYRFLQTPKGSYLFPDDMMNYVFFETNPLVQNNNKDGKDIKKAS